MPGTYDSGRTSKGQAKSMGGGVGSPTSSRMRMKDGCNKTKISKSAGNVRGSGTDQTGKKLPSARKIRKGASRY